MKRFLGCSTTGVLIELIFQSRLWNRHDLEQPLDDVLRLDTFRLRVEIGQDAVPENRISEGLNIFHCNVVTPVYQSQRFCAENQELRCAQAGAVIQVLLDKIRRIRASRTARAGELDRITHDYVRDRHFANETLEFDDIRSADGLFE